MKYRPSDIKIVLHRDADGKTFLKSYFHAFLMDQRRKQTQKHEDLENSMRRTLHETKERLPLMITQLEKEDWVCDSIAFNDAGRRANWLMEDEE
jgi:hypothetical protein